MLFSALLAALPLVSALVHDHAQPRALPERWYQADDHPAHYLFKRATDDGIQYPPVGSREWSAPFPPGAPDPNFLPQAWVDALDAAVAAGRIPDIPISHNQPQTNPVYPPGVNPSSPEVCSATYKCRHPEDIWDAPTGVFASSFDDGPYPTSPRLVEFLAAHNVKTTHFMIGVHILAHPQQFLATLEDDNDIAVHTWNHPYMTTLSNLDIVGQLGWTMQLIHHSSGGRVPRYWRPPYGDSDNRVRAIAKEVFGLETVIWNLDTRDWGLASGETTPEAIHQQYEQWLSGPKSPGLVILQHEVTDASVDIFMNVFPLISQNGWQFGSFASVVNDGRVYQNAANSSSDDVTFKLVIADGPTGSASSDSLSSSSTSDVGGLTPSQTVAGNIAHTTSSTTPSTSSESSGSRLPPLTWQVYLLLCSLAALLF